MPDRPVKISKGKLYLNKNEISQIKKIEHSNFGIKFYGKEIKFKKPPLSLQKNKTYNIKAYVPLKVYYKQKEIFPCVIN